MAPFFCRWRTALKLLAQTRRAARRAAGQQHQMAGQAGVALTGAAPPACRIRPRRPIAARRHQGTLHIGLLAPGIPRLTHPGDARPARGRRKSARPWPRPHEGAPVTPGEPSRTALAAAAHRAAHQVLEGGRVFADPLAARILGRDPAEIAASAADPLQRGMRFFICARARIAEDAAAAAIARGLRQVVILGAGLDSFAYRHPHGLSLRVFEVDHPATGAWKQARLAAAGIPIPVNVIYAGVDFERDRLVERLLAAGYDATLPGFFLWLGVVPYLTDAAIFATLDAIAALPGGAELVFDYGDPVDTLPPPRRAYLAGRAAQVAALGEAWLSFFDPPALHARLDTGGWRVIADLGPLGLARAFAAENSAIGNGAAPDHAVAEDAALAQDRGGHVIHIRNGA